MKVWSSWRLGLRVIRRTYSAVACRHPVRSLSSDGNSRLSTQEQNIVRSPYGDISVPDISLVELVWEMVEKYPEHTALVCALTGRHYTYAESRVIARRLAASLRKMAFKRGDTLALVLPNIPEFPLVLFGAIEAGCIVTTVNPIFTADEIRKQLSDSSAVGVITIAEVYANVSKAVSMIEAERKSKIPVIITPGLEVKSHPQGTINFLDMIHNDIDTSVLAADDRPNTDSVVVLPYSSGTTGLPKGVKLTHRNLVANCLQVVSEPKLSSVARASSDFQEVIPALLPFYHIYGLLSLAIASLQQGSKVVTVPKFEPLHFLSTVAQHKATILYLVPPLIQFIGSSPEVKNSHLESVTCIMNGAGPVGPNDVERLLKKISNVRFGQGYGLTECSPAACFLEKGSTKYTSSGKPVPNTDMKIMDMDTKVNLGPGKPGEICIKGPQVMQGYHNNPQATAETIDSLGWLHTGDMGYYDADSNFYIVDRYKELIKVKGLQVAPAELEDLLRSHPGIADAAVIGIPHERSGEVPKAFIVPKEPKLTEDDVKKFVVENVSEHKHLAGGVQFVPAIPRNLSGKILRKNLKEMYSK